ncbi:hypothetical protein ES705_19517 [subsurface metagenome]
MIDKEENRALNESIIRLIVAYIPQREACIGAHELLEKAIEYVNEAKPGVIPNHYGDYLLMKEKDGVQETRDLMISLRKEGVSDDDIRWYYNMGALRNWMFINTNNTIITLHLTHYEEEGMASNEAAIKLRKTMPIFGDSNIIPQGFDYRDRNLPPSLQRCVELYIARCMEKNPIGYQQDVYLLSSFNAYIREEIRLNRLKDIEDCGTIDEKEEIARFKEKIVRQEDQLFGIELYWETAKVSDYAGIIMEMEKKSYENIKKRTVEAIIRSKELLAQIESCSEFAEYLRLFQFPPIYGHPGLEEVTKRAEHIVKVYNNLFPNRSREKSLTDQERITLLQAADKE